MSAWLLLVRELHERGPILPAQVASTGFSVKAAVQQAGDLGLIVRRGSGRSRPLVLTKLGRQIATGRARVAPPPAAWRRGRERREIGRAAIPMVTWLAALPWPNEIRLART